MVGIRPAKSKGIVLNALLGLPRDPRPPMANIQEYIQEISNIILIKNPELFEEILRLYSDKEINRKLKIELNKARRGGN